MTVDYTAGVKTGYDTARRNRKKRSNYNWYRWVVGRNQFRLLYFYHTVTKWDHLRAELGPPLDPFLGPDGKTRVPPVGTRVKLLGVPILQWNVKEDGNYTRFNSTGYKKTHPCPYKGQEGIGWYRDKNGEKKEVYPQLMMVVNALPTSPGKEDDGVVMLTLRTEWFGRRSKGGKQECYGLGDLYAGYEAEREQGAEDTDDEGDVAPAGNAVVSGLSSIEGMGSAIVGDPEDVYRLEGDDVLYAGRAQDVVVIKREEEFFGGRVKGKALDLAAKGGPVKAYALDRSTHVPKNLLDHPTRGVKDLLALPYWFPGFSTDLERIEWAPAAEFTEAMSNRNSAKNAPRGSTEDPGDVNPGEVKKQAQEVEKFVGSVEEKKEESTPATSTQTSGSPFAPGDAVRFTSGGTTYVGTFRDTFDGGKKANVLLDPELQGSDDAKADVIGLRATNPDPSNEDRAVAGVDVAELVAV